MTRVFYSWQSDLPNNTNRGLIGDALESAARAIRDDESIEVEPVIDRDTSGVAGSPDIGATIFAKIDQAAAFVCDVSIVNAGGTRPAPNPNVLVELGWAAKALGWTRIVMVCNEAFGAVESLPFDLRAKRTICYSLNPDETDKAGPRKKLAAQIEHSLRMILATPQPARASPLDVALDGVARVAPDAEARIRDYWRWLVARIKELSPARNIERPTDDALVVALGQTLPLVRGFVQLCVAIARNDATTSAVALASGFGLLLQDYDVSPRISGALQEGDFDLQRFLGHELLVEFVAALMEHDRLETIAKALDVEHVIETIRGRENWGWTRLAKSCVLLTARKRRLSISTLSVHADLLRERRTGPETGLSTFDRFMESDLFLFYAAGLHPPGKPFDVGGDWWRPWSLSHMRVVQPTFLVRAERVGYARRLLLVWRLADLDTLKARISRRVAGFATLFDSWGMSVDGAMDLTTIATKK